MSQPKQKIRGASGVVATGKSPFAKLKPVPVGAVQLHDGFWKPRLDANTRASIPKMFELLKEHGVFDNFKRLYTQMDVPRRGLVFSDSDIYKWIEAAAFVLQTQEEPVIEDMLEEAIRTILPAQGEDGYLNTYYVDDLAEQRFTNLEHNHELYCAGHYFQAAVAHHRATGDTRLLSSARRFADYLCDVFGPGKHEGHPGHPEIEMALVELYRETGDEKYLNLARYFLTHFDIRQFETIWGHAVRAVYFASGGIDYYAESGDPDFLDALEQQWHSMVDTKMYLTGGVGSRYVGEAFGWPYELPNTRAYTETCAAIGSVFWNWRMLTVTGQAQFSNILERTLYNGFLSGVSLKGTEYFYVNPLQSTGAQEPLRWHDYGRRGPWERQPWYGCTCCPPNVERLLASLTGYFYSTSPEGVWVHLYDSSTVNWELADGTPFSLKQETNYPWEGAVKITVDIPEEKTFAIFVRIPDWCARATVKINGENWTEAVSTEEYCEIDRTWQAGDVMELDFDMAVEVMVANPRVTEDRGGCGAATRSTGLLP